MSLTVLANANILDVVNGAILPDRHVLIDGSKIREISDTALSANGARVIDLAGKTLMPGLIDAHVHASITTMKLSAMPNRPATLMAQEARVILEGMIARGFTSVRDAGGADWGMAESVRRGLVKGPRMFISGRVLSQTGGHGDFRHRGDYSNMCACSIYTGSFSHVADGVPAVRKAAREELRRGASQIKIMAAGGVTSPTDPIWNIQYSPEEMRAIVEEAEGWRTYAMAHAYTPESIQRCIEAGVRTIEHGNLVDACTARLMAEKGSYMVPTLVTYFKMHEHGAQQGLPQSSRDKLNSVLETGLNSLELCRETGVKTGFGTDLLGETHCYQSEEFTIRCEVLSPAEVIRSATITNAEILNKSDTFGSVEVGKLADLIAVDGNPLEDISLIAGQGEHIPLVMKAGEIMKEIA